MSMGAHDLPWSSEQREWLQALGHDVLMLAPVGSDVRADVARPSNTEAPSKSRSIAGNIAKPTPSAPPLLRALARAAGRSEDDAEFLQTVPDISVLCGNTAARRALWPRLRALRRRKP
ncbi:hypothetical protein [Lysobacter sp. Root494]|uniref:hypothetical protein n=1 Tax=Lysobacter sp. Root494 TaxID=1736549 RepID=UPI000B26060E|nr:hypothetical protein [Lysobacter sp. Root494]